MLRAINVCGSQHCAYQDTDTYIRHGIKGQLISECPYEKSVWTKYQRKYFKDFCPGSLLLQGYYKTESIFLQTEHKLSFCVNLEVVNFKNKNLGNIFVAIFVQTDFS